MTNGCGETWGSVLPPSLLLVSSFSLSLSTEIFCKYSLCHSTHEEGSFGMGGGSGRAGGECGNRTSEVVGFGESIGTFFFLCVLAHQLVSSSGPFITE